MHDLETYGQCIVYLLSKAYQRAHGTLKRNLEPFGLTPMQHLILAALGLEDGLSAGELGRRLRIDSATVSGTLERMADRGWVDKEPDPDDRRVVRVRMTPKARAAMDQLMEVREQTNGEVMEDLSLEEQVLLKRLLRDVCA